MEITVHQIAYPGTKLRLYTLTPEAYSGECVGSKKFIVPDTWTIKRGDYEDMLVNEQGVTLIICPVDQHEDNWEIKASSLFTSNVLQAV